MFQLFKERQQGNRRNHCPLQMSTVTIHKPRPGRHPQGKPTLIRIRVRAHRRGKRQRFATHLLDSSSRRFISAMAVSLSHRRRSEQSLLALAAAAVFFLSINPAPGRARTPPPVAAAGVADVDPAPDDCLSASRQDRSSSHSFRARRTE